MTRPPAEMVMLRLAVTAVDWVSVTLTVKLKVPPTVGVPEITPVSLSDRPGGSG